MPQASSSYIQIPLPFAPGVAECDPTPETLDDAALLGLLAERGSTLCRRAGGLRAALELPDADLARAGITVTERTRLRAALELGQRYVTSTIDRGEFLTSPAASRNAVMARLRDRRHEVFACPRTRAAPSEHRAVRARAPAAARNRARGGSVAVPGHRGPVWSCGSPTCSQEIDRCHDHRSPTRSNPDNRHPQLQNPSPTRTELPAAADATQPPARAPQQSTGATEPTEIPGLNRRLQNGILSRWPSGGCPPVAWTT